MKRMTALAGALLLPMTLALAVTPAAASNPPTTIEIRQHLHTEGAKVMANPTQVHQVIMNICTNAAHAMEKNGGIIEDKSCPWSHWTFNLLG